ncbi:MAG: methyltransferase domain-containing protein [Pirellulaceae bacterium]
MNDTLTFLKTFLRHPTQVGAIAPSGASLVRTMVEWFDWENSRAVVEFGPGTGVFTQAIQTKLHPDANFFAIERSPELAQATRTLCPGVQVYEDSVTNVAQLCDQQGVDQIDSIICGLPWASFSDELQTEIMETMLAKLKPGGQFATFAYWQGVVLPAGLRFSKRLNASFSSVEKSRTAWRNLPPAFVYRCVR